MMETETLNAIVSAHIKECDGRDARNTKSMERVESMFKGIWDTIEEQRKAITNLHIRGAMALGALIVLSKILDYFFSMQHK